MGLKDFGLFQVADILKIPALQTENMKPGPTGRSRRENFAMHESVTREA